MPHGLPKHDGGVLHLVRPDLAYRSYLHYNMKQVAFLFSTLCEVRDNVNPIISECVRYRLIHSFLDSSKVPLGDYIS